MVSRFSMTNAYHMVLNCFKIFWFGFFASIAAAATAWHIETVAGSGGKLDTGAAGHALAVNIGQPFGVEFGPDGSMFVCEVENHRVWRIDLKTQLAQVVAGNGEEGYSGDGGPAIAAAMNEPYEIRFDQPGNMYVVEMMNHLVRRVDAETGIIQTIAGGHGRGFAGDGGPALAAKLNRPHSIAIDESKQQIYIADIGNHRIRRVDMTTGIIETVVGTGEAQQPSNGSIARGNAIAGPRALFITPHDRTLWIGLREGHSVWRLNLDTELIHHVAGSGASGWNENVQSVSASAAVFNGPKGIAVDALGRVLLVDTENQAIRLIDLKNQTVTTIAGWGPENRGFGGDGGPGYSADTRLDRPHGIGVGPDGNAYIGDTNNHRVRRVSME